MAVVVVVAVLLVGSGVWSVVASDRGSKEPASLGPSTAPSGSAAGIDAPLTTTSAPPRTTATTRRTTTTTIPATPLLGEPTGHVAALVAGNSLVVVDLDTSHVEVYEGELSASENVPPALLSRGSEIVALSRSGTLFATNVFTGAQRHLADLPNARTGLVRLVPSQPPTSVWVAQHRPNVQHARLWEYAVDGTLLRELDLPSVGWVAGVLGEEVHVSTHAGNAAYDLTTGASRSTDANLIAIGEQAGALWITCDGLDCEMLQGVGERRPAPRLATDEGFFRELSPNGTRALVWKTRDDGNLAGATIVDLSSDATDPLSVDLDVRAVPPVPPPLGVAWLPDAPWLFSASQAPLRLVAVNYATDETRTLDLPPRLPNQPYGALIVPKPANP